MVAELFASIVSKCCLISYVHEFRIRRILDHSRQYSNGINRSNICFGLLLEKHRYTSFTLKHGREWLKLILEFLKELRIVELN